MAFLWGEGHSSVVDSVFGVHKVLGSNPSTSIEKKKGLSFRIL